jgi:hypothetical protein
MGLHPLTFSALRQVNVARCVESFHPIEEWSPTDWGCAAAVRSFWAGYRIERANGGPSREEMRLSAVEQIGSTPNNSNPEPSERPGV